MQLRRAPDLPTRGISGLILNAVSKQFKGSSAPALNNVSLTVAPGDTVAIFAESGSGKTTLLRIIAGFEQLDCGEVILGELRVADKGHYLPPEARGVGVVFQDTALLPHLTIRQNIAFGLHRLTESERRKRVDEIIDCVQITDAQNRFPHQVSGGQAQRAAIARALAPQPRILLLDEPFNNLDGPLKAQLIDQLRTVLSERKTTTIFVTHDRDEAFSIADRIAVLRSGFLQQEGTPEEIYWQPNNHFVAGLLGKTNLIRVHQNGTEWISPLGPITTIQPLEVGGEYLASVRPSQIYLLNRPRGQATTRGIVVSERFLGELRELRIKLPNEHESLEITAHTSAVAKFSVGDHVYVSLTC